MNTTKKSFCRPHLTNMCAQMKMFQIPEIKWPKPEPFWTRRIGCVHLIYGNRLVHRLPILLRVCTFSITSIEKKNQMVHSLNLFFLLFPLYSLFFHFFCPFPRAKKMLIASKFAFNSSFCSQNCTIPKQFENKSKGIKRFYAEFLIEFDNLIKMTRTDNVPEAFSFN